MLGIAWACAEAPESVEGQTLLEECAPGEGPDDARCGTIQVFEDRDRAAGRTIDLNVVVYPARSRDAQPDPVFVLAGGPGQAAAQLSEMLARMLGDVRVDRDLVFVDQRGTGESNGLPCEEDSDDLQLIGDTDHFVKTILDCLEGYDADLGFYTTPVAMDDLNEVREKLGYGAINLWGGSYGTRAALVYLRRHGDTVRSAVLDGAVPLAMKLPASFALDGQRAMDLVFDACEAEDPCHRRFPELRIRFAELLERLDRGAIDAELRHPRTGEDQRVKVGRALVTGMLRTALYESGTASMVPLIIDQAHRGDFRGLFALALATESVPKEATMYFGMHFAVMCAEDLPWINTEETRQEGAGTFLGGSYVEIWERICGGREWGIVGEDYRDPVRSAVPTLVLSGELDPVTPPRWGETTLESLPNGRHIVVPGLAHGTSSMGCVPGLIDEFLREIDPAALDDGCVHEIQRPPFFVTHGGPTMAGAQ